MRIIIIQHSALTSNRCCYSFSKKQERFRFSSSDRNGPPIRRPPSGVKHQIQAKRLKGFFGEVIRREAIECQHCQNHLPPTQEQVNKKPRMTRAVKINLALALVAAL